MAVQFHVAHSRVVDGVGALAGGPYYCAQGSVWLAYYNCLTPGAWTPLPATSLLKAETDGLAQSGQIDAASNIAHAKVWLFSGRNDTTLTRDVVQALADFYALYKVKATLVDDKPAGHGMVTDHAGNACPTTKPPFINNCNFDAAAALLGHLLGPLQERTKPSGTLIRFDQKAFGSAEAGMADDGYVYVPDACKAGGCRVHVVFHGCRQNAETLGERFMREAGYDEWAEANRLIVLYPQTTARYFPLFNPRACWDWWGYSSALYHTRSGPQIRAVKGMIDRLAAPK